MRRLKLNYIVCLFIFLICVRYINILPIILLSVISIIGLYFLVKNRLLDNKYNNKTMQEIDQMEGTEFERYLQARFRDMGYKANLTSKTGDYGADLLIEKNNELIIVQAKRYNNTVGVKAIQEAISAQSFYDAARSLVITNNYFTKNAKIMAAKCNVRLIDRDSLYKLIKK